MSCTTSPSKALTTLTSTSDFDAWVLTSPEALHVLLCGAHWDEASAAGGPMDAVLTALSGAHPGAHFARVDSEDVPGVSDQLSINVVPTFVLFRAKAVVERVEGPNAAAVTRLVEASALRASAAVVGGGGGEGAPPGVLPPSLVALRARLERLVTAAPVMVFIKGTPAEPRCKFSRQLLDILKGAGVAYGSFDILTDEAVRQGLKDFSQWPTYPQLYVSGKLIGGVDIAQELKDSGELASVLPAPAPGTAGGAPAGEAAAAGAEAARAKIAALLAAHPVVLMIKGTAKAPACGFSERALKMLADGGVALHAFDVIAAPDVREEAKALFGWKTFPMLFVAGKLVGGFEAIKGMTEHAAGGGPPLAQQLGLAPAEPLADRLQRLVGAARVVLFMKGSFASPRCGFSRQAVDLLKAEGAPVGAAAEANNAPAGAPFPQGELAQFDILSDEVVREGLKKTFNWPTFPMLFVDKALVGGLDVMREMQEEGELAALLRFS